MKILVIGKRGMLGSAIYDEFSSRDVEVIGTTSEDLDVTDERLVMEYLMKVKPDVVINCTGYTNVEQAEEDYADAEKLNADAVMYLAKTCKSIDASLVHFSTDYVFSGVDDGYSEEAVLSPINNYGRSKALGERLLIDNMEKFYLIRLSWLFGPNGNNFVTTMVRLGKERDELSIVNDQFGKPTYTLDVAKMLPLILESEAYGIYHLPNEGKTTWYRFALEIFKLNDINIKVLPITSDQFPMKAERPKNAYLINNSNFVMRPWEDALGEYIEILKKESN